MYYTKPEAAKILRCSISAVDRMLRNGVIRKLNKPGKVLILASSIDALAKQPAQNGSRASARRSEVDLEVAKDFFK